LLAVYIHRLYRFRNRANQAIRDLELEKKRLLEKEIERINQELEQNRKSLTATSLKLIQNSERDAGNVRRLESVLDGTSPEGRKILLSIISDIKRMSRSTNWNEFELLFQKVHKSFYDGLNDKFPDLTANERKLCAFLKLNMSSKDIANITFQSEEALKKARQRLRQKLGIDRDTNLVVFLQNI
jgi:DNA-binding CsgD family transcriptional regulator